MGNFYSTFMGIFVASHLERLMALRWLARGLAGITPAVAGVVASTSI
ncbi:MAG: hypothetical protein RMX26_06780 [Planktomarina sp.]|nr:hypothetical protein [Planktomarina sp.]